MNAEYHISLQVIRMKQYNPINVCLTGLEVNNLSYDSYLLNVEVNTTSVVETRQACVDVDRRSRRLVLL